MSIRDSYIVSETDENGMRTEYHCKTYEDARKLLDSKAEKDKATLTECAEIKHSEERYTRICNESQKSYALSIKQT